MAIKTIDDIFQDYRAALLAKQPTANVDQTDSDYYIRGQAVAGVAAGVYSDVERDALDAFPQSGRRESLLRWKFALFGVNTFDPATVATGPAAVTGTTGVLLPSGTQATHTPTGNVYSTTADVTLSGGTATPNWQSVNAGQAQNLEASTVLTISSPPAGIDATVTVQSPGIQSGTDEEDEKRLATRLLNRLRQSARGGDDADHIEWALEILGVTGASVIRFPNGLGTVSVIITSGTTDIDSALNGGQDITFTPSSDLITAVQDFIQSVCPLIECVFVYGPIESNLNVTTTVSFISGVCATLVNDPLNPGTNITQGDMVKREIQRAIYKTPVGGTVIGTANYVTKKAIEDMIDTQLSGADTIVGSVAQMVKNRAVANLDGGNVDKAINANVRILPGTITVSDA